VAAVKNDGPGQFEAMAFFITVILAIPGAVALGFLFSVWAALLAPFGAIMFVIVLSLVRPKIYRLMHFLFLLGGPPKAPPARGARLTAWGCVIRNGADPDDPMAPRVIVTDSAGEDHVTKVLRIGDDAKKELRETVVGLQVPVREVRAEAGGVVVQRWRPRLASRFRAAWQVAWSS
jgi:hypothetical protein